MKLVSKPSKKNVYTNFVIYKMFDDKIDINICDGLLQLFK